MSTVLKSAVMVALALFIAGATMSSINATAQVLTPYSEFQQMSLAQLDSLQGRVTFVGPHLKGVRSVGFTATGHSFDATPFVPFYRMAFREYYSGDFDGPRMFAASDQQLRALIDSVGTLTSITAGGVDSGGYVSFALMKSTGGVAKVFEAIVDTGNGRRLLATMVAALNGTPLGQAQLSDFACAVDMLPSVTPRDASGDVSIRLRGVRRDRPTGQFVGTVTVTNTSGQTLSVPTILVLRAEGNVEIANASGRTCRIYPTGSSYIVLPVGAGLAPSAHVDVVTRFSNPDGEQIKLTAARVFSGSGTR